MDADTENPQTIQPISPKTGLAENGGQQIACQAQNA